MASPRTDEPGAGARRPAYLRRFPAAHATDCLERLFVAAFDDQPLDPVVSDWLVSGILCALRDDLSLDRALGLAAEGRPATRYRVLCAKRDMHLRRAAAATDLGDASGAWERCRRLAVLLPGFVANTWPRVKALQRAPDYWPLYRRELFAAAATGLELPTSARQLHRLVTRNGAFSCHEAPGIVLARFI